MKVKYDPQATYVLHHNQDDYLRIVCEANKTSLLTIEETTTNSGFTANLKSINFFVEMGYKIVQEWK